MKSRNFSIRLSLEIYELLNKIALHTGMRKREIIEKAILEFAKNNYGELLSKDVNEVLKESLEKSLSSISKEEKEEMEKWRKVLLRFISYHIMKTRLLYNYYFGSDVDNQSIPKQLHSLKSYENSLTKQILKLLPEVEDYKTTNFIIKFVDVINRLNSVEIIKSNEWDKEWKIKDWEILKLISKQFPSRAIHWSLGSYLKSIDLFYEPEKKIIDEIKNYILENFSLKRIETPGSEKYIINNIIKYLIIDNLDYYFTPILESINKKFNTNFNNLSQLFEHTRQLINRETYMDDVIKIHKFVILDFIKYLEKIKNIIKKGGLPKKKPKKFIINKTIEYLAESQVIKNFMLAWQIYSDLTSLITKEFIDKVMEDVETKVINYLKERFKDKVIKREYGEEVKYYYKINEKDIEEVKEELKNILLNSVKS